MAALDLIPVIDEGLGDSTYILDLGDGRPGDWTNATSKSLETSR